MEDFELFIQDTMKAAIIGASGKTGIELVRQALERGYETVGVCRESSVRKLDAFISCDGFTLMSTPVVSNEHMLTQALAGCDAVVAVPISVGHLKATELVTALAKAAAANGVKRLVFTAGEVTVAPEADEAPTLRQHLMLPGFTFVTWFTPYSLSDMRKASALIKQQAQWEWTIVRAPTLTDAPSVGYRFCRLSEVTSKHVMSREDYAACLLNCLTEPGHRRRMLTVVSAKE
jgi:putative NADH-flavin reductase